MKCARCNKPIVDEKNSQICWWCEEDICYECWDDVGHCGHPEAEAENERARKVEQPK